MILCQQGGLKHWTTKTCDKKKGDRLGRQLSEEKVNQNDNYSADSYVTFKLWFFSPFRVVQPKTCLPYSRAHSQHHQLQVHARVPGASLPS